MTCVRSTSTRGVAAIGHTTESLQLVQRMEARRIRCITGNPRRAEGMTMEDIHARFSINIATSRPGAGTAPAHPVPQQFSCTYRGQVFASLHTMRIHCARKHGTSFIKDGLSKGATVTTADVVIKVHCREGLPICKHCGRSFRKWQEFKGHVLSCPVLHGQMPLTESPSNKADPIMTSSGNATVSATGLPIVEPTRSAEQSAARPCEPSHAASNSADHVPIPYFDHQSMQQHCLRSWVDFAEI